MRDMIIKYVNFVFVSIGSILATALLLLPVFLSNSYAADGDWALSYVCDSGSIYKNRVSINIVASGGTACESTSGCSIELIKDEYSGGSCTCERMLSGDCLVETLHICCDSAWVAAKGKLEDAVGRTVTVTGVPPGSEKGAAETAFNNYDLAALYPDHSSGGYSRTDAYKGYVYTSTLNNDDTSTVNVDMWKRGGYAPTGSSYTLDQLQSSSSGTQLSSEGVANGVSSALTANGLTGNDIGSKINSGWDYAHTQGYLQQSGGTDLTVATFPGVKPSDLAGTFTGDSTAGLDAGSAALSSDEQSSIKSAVSSTVTAGFNSFVTDMKTTSLYHAVGDFFDSSHIPVVNSPVDVNLSTNYFGSIQFSLGNYSTFWNILKVVMLISFGYCSVRVVMHR